MRFSITVTSANGCLAETIWSATRSRNLRWVVNGTQRRRKSGRCCTSTGECKQVGDEGEGGDYLRESRLAKIWSRISSTFPTPLILMYLGAPAAFELSHFW